MYFLRFTNTPDQDLERATSIHAHDDGEHVVLDGLCGYALDASTLEEAIEEVSEGNYQFAFVGEPVIFSGKLATEDDIVPDGDLFTPFKIARKI